MLKSTANFLVGGIALMLLASCGGGGDIAGDSKDFAVSPNKWTREVQPDPEGGCGYAVGSPLTFTIVGGQAPFRIVNAAPHGLSVDKTEATGKDPKFTVTPAGGCGDPFTITVLDYHSQVATVEITVKVKEETAATTP